MLRVGLTGGIASGKSHVAARLVARGFRLLDLDRVAHGLMAPGGPAYADVVGAFGPGILKGDGSIDRRSLGGIVFADAAARARLNAIVHPRVREEESRHAAALAGEPHAVLVVEAALLVESGMHLRFDRLLVAHCAPEEQRRRLMARDRIDAAAAEARLAAQMGGDAKRRFAHRVIDTSGAPADTEARTDILAADLERLAGEPVLRVPLALEAAAALALGAEAVAVRGLTASLLLEEMAAGLELERLARRLDPVPPGPWYAHDTDDRCAAEGLSGPVALYALCRRGVDPEYAAGVAYSVARLTHVAPASVGRAVLWALALQEAATGLAGAPSAAARALAERWSGWTPGPEDCAAARARVGAGRGPDRPDPALRASLERLLQQLG